MGAGARGCSSSFWRGFFFLNDLLILHIHSGHLVQTRAVRHISKEIEACVWWGGQTGRWETCWLGSCVPRLSAAGQQCQGSCCSGVSDVFRVTPKGRGWGGWGKAFAVAEAAGYVYVVPAVDKTW